jgi:2TM domain-containing protein
MSDQISINDEIRRRVETYYKERTTFAMHFVAFFIVNIIAWWLWRFSGITLSLAFPWPLLLTAGWGAGLVAHGIDVSSYSPRRAETLERTVRARMEQIYGEDWEADADEEAYRRVRATAAKYFEDRNGFAIHLAVYAILNPAAWLICIMLGWSFIFPILLTLGWSIGLAAHGIDISFHSNRSTAARERAIRDAQLRVPQFGAQPKEKRKHDRLVLSEDGELLDIVEDEQSLEEKPKRR